MRDQRNDCIRFVHGSLTGKGTLVCLRRTPKNTRPSSAAALPCKLFLPHYSSATDCGGGLGIIRCRTEYSVLVSALRFVQLRKPELGLFLCCRMSSQLSRRFPKPPHHNQDESQRALDLFNSSASLRYMDSIDCDMLVTAQCSGLHAVGKDAVSPVFVTLPGRLAGFSGPVCVGC